MTRQERIMILLRKIFNIKDTGKNTQNQGWGHGSSVECLPSKSKALPQSTTTKIKQNKIQKLRNTEETDTRQRGV
jgi:hypothetical protein